MKEQNQQEQNLNQQQEQNQNQQQEKQQNQSVQNKQAQKKNAIFGMVALLIVAVIGASIAYFSSTASFVNEFQTATYRTVTTEVFESPTNWTPGETVPKTIETTNEGSIPVAVRTSYTEAWEDLEGNPVQSPANAVTINFDNTTEWTKEGNYYYYNYKLNPNETTSSFISGVTLNDGVGTVTCTPSQDGLTQTCEATNAALGKVYKLTITTETIQFDSYEDVWNTNVEIIDKPVYSPGDIVYFDPVSTNTCDSATYSLSDINNNTSTCYKWRVITVGDTLSNTDVTIQLDHNLLNTSEWNPFYTDSGPTTVLSSLATATAGWTRVPALNYTYDTTGAENNYGVMTCINGICNKTVDNVDTLIAGTSEVPVRARLITGEELKAIVLDAGAEPDSSAGTWTIGSSKNFTLSGSSGFLTWLVENTTADSTSSATDNIYGANNWGYWSITPMSNNPDKSFAVYFTGSFARENILENSHAGARPVITISKSNITSD